MSDSDDDWETALDEKLEDKKEEKKPKDEDEYDSDEENKKKAAEKKAANENAAKNAVKKEKVVVMTQAERNALRREQDAKQKKEVEENKQKMSAGAKIVDQSKRAEEDIVDALFEPEVETTASGLKSTKDYAAFGKKVSSILYEGSGPYNIPVFFTEILREIGKTSITADQLKKIQDAATVAYNNKVKEEKVKTKGKPKKNQKASLGGVGKGASYDRNNNPGMVNDLMGDNENAYGDEYGEEKVATGGQRVEEEDYDFM